MSGIEIPADEQDYIVELLEQLREGAVFLRPFIEGGTLGQVGGVVLVDLVIGPIDDRLGCVRPNEL